jgi:hypothetical protein
MLIALVGSSLPLSLVQAGLLPVSEGLLWLIIVTVGGALGLWLRIRRIGYLPLGSRETWFFTVSTFFGIIGIGVSLITLSTFGASTNSTCASPTTVNVTSPNCVRILNHPPSGGNYSNWGPAGAFLTLLGVVGLGAFGILAGFFYLLYGQNPPPNDYYP